MIISGDPAAGLEEGAELEPDAERRSIEFESEHQGMRLDLALTGLVPEFSRSYLQQLIEAGCVNIEGKTCLKPSAKVQVGRRGVIELRPTPQSQAFRPEPIEIPVVFGDAHLWVIDKPAGLVVHPAPGNWSGTLLNGLLAMDPYAAQLPRAGIVHRLDKNTSGLMVVARTRPVMDALVKMIAAREVSRQYVAISHRPWTGPKLREVTEPMGRDPRNRLRMAVVDIDRHPGKPAQTTVELMDTSDHGCLVLCSLHTGRTHQIRVHMAALGHPLVDDALYGGAPVSQTGRQALHALRLAFDHPVTGEAMRFKAPLPADLQALLYALSLHYNETL